MKDTKIIFIILLIIISLAAILVYKIFNDSNSVELGSKIHKEATDAILNSSIDLESKTIKDFNSTFENYKGTQTGTNVRSLLSIISSHNLIFEYKVSVNYNNTTYLDNINNIKSSISASETYTISFSYDSTTQYIETVIIK